MSDEKIAEGITKFERNLHQNNSKTVTNGDNKETPKDGYKSREEQQKFVYNFRLI